jgi:hypothetical protein
MKKAAILFSLSIIFFSCEKKYDEEIFISKYQIIYGEWRHIRTENGFRNTFLNTDDYTIKFIPIGIFYNNEGKKDLLSIYQQDESQLIVNFHNMLGDGRLKDIQFFGKDTMRIDDEGYNWMHRLFVRTTK